MTCVICKQAEARTGKATVTLEHGGTTLVIKGVPARVCPTCGEEYVDEKTAAELLETAKQVARSGVQVEIREYMAVQ
jgi:YgiT-type zinc finger domain-containing protein